VRVEGLFGPRVEIRPRAVNRESDVEQASADRAFRRRRGRAQGDVGLAPAEVGDRVGDVELDLDARIGAPEGGQDRRQDRQRQGIGGGHPNDPAETRVAPREAAPERRHLGLDPGRRRRRVLAGGGTDVARGQALEQADALAGLDRLETPENGGVVDAEGAGGARQAAVAGHREDEFQIVPIEVCAFLQRQCSSFANIFAFHHSLSRQHRQATRGSPVGPVSSVGKLP